jgi:hypothetical protein
VNAPRWALAALFTALTALVAACLGSLDDLSGGAPRAADAGPEATVLAPNAEAGVTADATVDAPVSARILSVDPLQLNTSQTFDLTAVGPTDWVNWSSEPSRCGTCLVQISPIVGIGGPLDFYDDDPDHFAWSNGSPTKSGTSTSGVFVSGASNGVSFTVNAGPTRSMLVLWLVMYSAAARLSVGFGDANEITNADVPSSAVGTSANYFTRIHLAAPHPATVRVTWTVTTALDGANAGAIAAALAPEP